MSLTRRQALAAAPAMLAAPFARSADAPPRSRMGVVIHSYSLQKFADPLAFLDHARSIGAGGVQTAIGVRDDAFAAKLNDFTKKHGLFLEGSISLPKDKADVDRFATEVRSAKRCGADVLRTVLMSGRRYEVFDSAEAFRTFFDKANASLALARKVIEKEEVRLAVENHKDLQAADQVEMLKKLDSPLVGVCLDTGNNVALLEPPDETVGLLAPLVFTTHVKDMGVEEYADGFLLSEVPLGAGFLDLPKVAAAVRKANPKVRLNLEMITRDPLKIPCLTPKYWTTLETVPAKRLAAMLTLVRAKAGKKPLPRVRDLPRDEQQKIEDDNVRASLKYAGEKLDA
ncbi:MAG TPA: TIM barrel protein [Gemmata sp.]|nr:TIM barrel protein [Gemmata sp.]